MEDAVPPTICESTSTRTLVSGRLWNSASGRLPVEQVASEVTDLICGFVETTW